jgi:hypothetical protein
LFPENEGHETGFIITGTGAGGGAETMLHKILARLSPEFKPHVISMAPVAKIEDKLRAWLSQWEVRI